jgi:anti-sigma B factor antagonist
VVQPDLRVTVEWANGVVGPGPTVKVRGELDIQTTPVLEEELRSALDRGASTIVVDLCEVSFLDSTGLSVLVSGLKRCQAAGGELRLEGPRPNVRKVLEITGLTDAFKLSDSNGGGAAG